MEPIRSASNPTVKHVRAVRAGKHPELLLLEGDRLVDDALASGLELELLLVADTRAERSAALAAAGQEPVEIDAELLGRISDLKTSPGILALAPAPAARSLGDLAELGPDDAGRAALVLVVDGLSDPVNLGALARSAEAAGARALVHIAGGAGPWNTRALRGSMGSLLRLPVLRAEDPAEVVAALASAGLRILRPDTRGGRDWRTVDWAPPTAIWIGGETRAADASAAAFEGVTIPMQGAVESLNVTVAASLLLFAAGRSGPPPEGGA